MTTESSGDDPEQQLRRQLHTAVDAFVDFVGVKGLTARTSELETELLDQTSSEVPNIVERAGLTDDALAGALTIRAQLGRISDLVHAATIALALPHVLEPGERIIVKPSLGPGNKGRPFDLETDRRIAEFKVAVWKGADSMRQRGLVKDIVALALEPSSRRKYMYVVGTVPLHYLTTTRTTVTNRLARNAPASLRLAWDEFRGSSDPTIACYFEKCGVRVVDLTEIVPGLGAAIDAVAAQSKWSSSDVDS